MAASKTYHVAILDDIESPERADARDCVRKWFCSTALTRIKDHDPCALPRLTLPTRSTKPTSTS